MRRALTAIGALVAVQALLVGIWLAVDGGRAPAPAATAAVRTTPLDLPVPDLALRGPGGAPRDLRDHLDQPLVLHFWASFCPPCREELPGLLAFAAETGTPVLAVSLDGDWTDVAPLLGSPPPPGVVLAAGEDVARAFDVRALPVTFVVGAGARLRLRLDGPRDWESAELRALVGEAGRAGGP